MADRRVRDKKQGQSVYIRTPAPVFYNEKRRSCRISTDIKVEYQLKCTKNILKKYKILDFLLYLR